MEIFRIIYGHNDESLWSASIKKLFKNFLVHFDIVFWKIDQKF